MQFLAFFNPNFLPDKLNAGKNEPGDLVFKFNGDFRTFFILKISSLLTEIWLCRHMSV